MKRILLLIPVFLSIILLSGCWMVDSDFRTMRKDVFKYAGIQHADREIEISVGKLELYLAEKFVSLDANKMDLEIMLGNISNVQLGVYNYNSGENYGYDICQSLDNPLYKKGWTRLLMNRNGDELNLAYINSSEPERINKMMFFIMDDEQIVFITVEGRLERIVSHIIKNRGLHR